MKCPDCENGYNLKTYTLGGEIVTVKIWCETCKGTGHIKYEGERDDIAFGGE